MLRKRINHGPIGLDWGAACVKVLQFSFERGSPSILAAAQLPLPGDLTDRAERSAAAAELLTDALHRYSFAGREVATALGTGEFQIKSLRLPRMPEEELASAVQFEAHDRFSFSSAGAQVRHIPAGEVRHGNELKEEVLVLASDNQLIQERLTLLEGLKLRPVAMDLTPCAVARSFVRFLRRAEDAQAVNVFVDVGWRGSAIIITRGTELAFLKMVDIGGEQFTAAVAKAMGLPTAEAAELRIRIMRESAGNRPDIAAEPGGTGDQGNVGAGATPNEVRARVADAVRPFVERIGRDVQMCLRYFAVTFRGQKPDSLTFVGGEAHEPSLTRIVSETVETPCLIGHPLRGIPIHGGSGEYQGIRNCLQDRTTKPAWATACGLALRGVAAGRAEGSRGRRSERQAGAVAAGLKE